MEYRLLGNSGCAVSALALGALTFGNETDEAGSFAQLDRFAEVGGTLIDTADVYADHHSEEIIGRWLGQRPAARETVVLATKGASPPTKARTGTAPPAATWHRRSTRRCGGSAWPRSTSIRSMPGIR